MLHLIVLLTTTCALVFTPSVNASNIKAYGNEADNDGNIKWGSLPRRKEGDFLKDRGGVLIGLYAMTNAIIYAVHPSNIDYGRSIQCYCVVRQCLRENSIGCCWPNDYWDIVFLDEQCDVSVLTFRFKCMFRCDISLVC